MHRWQPVSSRVVLTLLAAATLALTVSAAEAGGRRRYKGSYRVNGYTVRRYVRPIPVVRRSRYVHRIPVGAYTLGRPVSGGFLAFGTGGVALGFTLGHRLPFGYAYYDPYCHDYFPTLSVYHNHCRLHRHASVIRVVERDRGYDDYDRWDGRDGDRYHDDCEGCEEGDCELHGRNGWDHDGDRDWDRDRDRDRDWDDDDRDWDRDR